MLRRFRTLREIDHATCGIKYSDEYDNYWCPVHEVWLEDRCNDPECIYCTQRPDKNAIQDR